MGVLLVLSVFVIAGVVEAQLPLDIGGFYDKAVKSRCRSGGWSCQGKPTCCATEGCTYQERMTISSPRPDGNISLTVVGNDQSCYTGSMGPWYASVDSCGRVLAGVNMQTRQYFDPTLTDQDLSMFLTGSVEGFNGQPAGFQHTMITRDNITICDTEEFLQGTCSPGTLRFVCGNEFAYCAGGDCLNKNKNILSPPTDAYFARLTTTGLNGTYDIQAGPQSSKDCPADVSVYHFGTQVGIGWGLDDMHMTRLVDSSMATVSASCVQFYSFCNGLQWRMDMGLSGRFTVQDNKYLLQIFFVRPKTDPGAGTLDVDKCLYLSRGPAPPLYKVYAGQHPAIVGLAVSLAIFIVLSGLFFFCCLSYRRRYILSKYAPDRAYNLYTSQM